METVFDKAYKTLNPEQKRAVEAIEGPVMVIAGPGTGKTQILALRIANILLKTDTAPGNILALTFTESGVYSMRRRLVDTIGAAAYKINIHTFHGFCNTIIGQFPDEFPRIISANPATDIDQIQIVEKLLDAQKFEIIRPYGDPAFYVRPILGAIRNLKRENIDAEGFVELVKQQQKNFKNIPDLVHEKGAHKGKMKGVYTDLQKSIEKNAELAKVYVGYEQELQTRKLYDYEDMILEAIRSMEKNPDFLLQLQEQYQYILADEHQDANASQNRVLELLSNFHTDPNLFIVGDEKQAIFRFQGANLDNFLYFKKLYPSAIIISLKNNYRSTQTILDAAHSLIANNAIKDESLRVTLEAKAKHALQSVPISLRDFSSADFELQYLKQDIEQKINAGITPSEIAVIYRDNKDAEPIVRMFQKAGIEYSIQSDQNVLNDEHIGKLISLFELVVHPGNEEFLARALYIDFLNIPTLDVFKLNTFAYRNKKSLYECLSSKELLQEAGVKNVSEIVALSEKIALWQSLVRNKNVVDVFEHIMNESGFLADIISLAGSLDSIAKLDRLFTEARRLIENKKNATLIDFVEYINTLKKYNVLIKAGVVGSEQGGVRLMTAHRSKGLEFEYVYIVGAVDGKWGNKKEFNYFKLPLAEVTGDALEDERRLFYVALTRAKKAAFISSNKRSLDGKEQVPAQFVSELDPSLVSVVDTKESEATFAEHPEEKYTPVQDVGLRIDDKQYLQKLFLEQGLSATALNKYLQCPWDYFFSNLIHIPEADSKPQLYGTAIHYALQTFFNAYSLKEDISLEKFVSVFEDKLAHLPVSSNDFIELKEKGTKALTGYYKAHKGTWSRDVRSEVFVSGATLPFEVGGKNFLIPLRGKLDKIEFISDSEVAVVDYKTGKPKSRNELLGTTKNATGDYFRQLVFYRLLLAGYENGNYNLKHAMIDFIEPDDKGNYHREQFEITDENLEELKSLMQKTAQEIYNFDFWQKKCNEKDCHFCTLRSYLKNRD